MRPRDRYALLALVAVGVFLAVIAISGARSRSSRAPDPSAVAPTDAAPAPTSLAPAGSRGARASDVPTGPPPGHPLPPRPARSLRFEHGALDGEALARARFVLQIMDAEGVAHRLTWMTFSALRGSGDLSSSRRGVTASLTTRGMRSEIRLEGLPPGGARAVLIVRGVAGVLGIGGPASIDVDAKDTAVDVVPADRLGVVVADVRRGGAAFGPARVEVRVDGLVIDSLSGVRGRASPVTVPTGTRIEVALVESPGHEALGLPPPREVILAPREQRHVPFDLDDGVTFTVRALGPDGSPLPFRLLAWTDPDGDDPRPVPGLLLTSGSAFRHAGRGPVGELALLLIPSRKGAPTWARVSLAGRADVPVDVRVGLQGAVLDLRLVDAAGKAWSYHVELVRADAERLEDFVAWSGDVGGDGRLVTPPLPAGAYLLEVGGRYVRLVTLDAMGSTLSFTVPDLLRAGHVGPVLDVTTSDAEGRPVGIARAYVRPEGEGWGRRLLPRRDEPGRFDAVDLSAGRYRVVVPWTWGGGARHGTVDVPVTLQGDRTVRLDVRVPAP